MKIGVVFPQTEIGDDPVAIRDFVQAAEDLGYTHLRIYDHVLGAVQEHREPKLVGPYTERDAFHEPFVLCGFLAAATSTIELVTGVVILPQRQTALVAKQAAEVDVLSGGRLRLGVGTGWNYVEYEALGEDFTNRGARQEEQLEVMRRLWTEPVVDFSGRWHRIDRAGILPRPSRPIPLWLGGFADVVYRRAARVADGFIFGTRSGPVPEVVDALRRYAADAGRDPAAFGLDVLTQLSAGPDQWGLQAAAMRGLGVTHLTVSTMGAGLATPKDHIEALPRYLDAVR